MATESLPGTLPHESKTFGLAESRTTMQDSAQMFDQLATLFDEIGGSTGTPHIGNLAGLGAYYAREHAAGQWASLEVGDPEDLQFCANCLAEASEYFANLESLFLAILDRSEDKALARVGQYAADDFANTMDVARERAAAAVEETA